MNFKYPTLTHDIASGAIRLMLFCLIIVFSAFAPVSSTPNVTHALANACPITASGTDNFPNNVPVEQGQTFTFNFYAPTATSIEMDGTFIGVPFSLFGGQSIHFTGTAAASGTFYWYNFTFDTPQGFWWNYSISCNAAIFTDGRINPEAQATMVGYCTDDHGITAYLPNGNYLFTATAQQIANGLASAQKLHKHILIKQSAGEQLWALKSNELQFHNALGVKYDFIFPANRCG